MFVVISAIFLNLPKAAEDRRTPRRAAMTRTHYALCILECAAAAALFEAKERIASAVCFRALHLTWHRDFAFGLLVFFSPATFCHAQSHQIRPATFGDKTATRVRLDLHVRPFQEPTVL